MTYGCPICKRGVYSDTDAEGFCGLCGMPLEKSKTLVLRQRAGIWRFCSGKCLDQFVETNGSDGGKLLEMPV